MTELLIEKEFEYELIEGEKLLWTGKPRKGILFESTDRFYIPVSLIFTAVATMIFITVRKAEINSAFQWYILLFVIVGFYNLFGRFFYDSWRRANISYAITGTRAIIRSGIFTKKYRSIYISDISELNKKFRQDGSGTIIFGPDIVLYWVSRIPRTDLPPKFERVANVQEPYSLLLKLQEGSIK